MYRHHFEPLYEWLFASGSSLRLRVILELKETSDEVKRVLINVEAKGKYRYLQKC